MINQQYGGISVHRNTINKITFKFCWTNSSPYIFKVSTNTNSSACNINNNVQNIMSSITILRKYAFENNVCTVYAVAFSWYWCKRFSIPLVDYSWKHVTVMEYNATFNNISVVSWRSGLLVKKTGVPREDHRPAASHWQTLSHNIASSWKQVGWLCKFWLLKRRFCRCCFHEQNNKKRRNYLSIG